MCKSLKTNLKMSCKEPFRIKWSFNHKYLNILKYLKSLFPSYSSCTWQPLVTLKLRGWAKKDNKINCVQLLSLSLFIFDNVNFPFLYTRIQTRKKKRRKIWSPSIIHKIDVFTGTLIRIRFHKWESSLLWWIFPIFPFSHCVKDLPSGI